MSGLVGNSRRHVLSCRGSNVSYYMPDSLEARKTVFNYRGCFLNSLKKKNDKSVIKLDVLEIVI